MAIYIPIVSEFKSSGIDKAKKEFKSLDGAAAKTGFIMKKAFVPASAALGALTAGLFTAVDAAIQDEKAATELARSLKATTGATDAIVASTEDWISQQGRLLGVADDQLRPVLSKLARATGSVTRSQELATKAMDIAAATGKPLETVTDALTKALGGNMTALGKLAPEFREMVREGASFDDIMAEMSKTMGGAATEAANTSAGRLERLKLTMGELVETIGALVLPILEKLIPVLEKMAGWAERNPTAFLIIAAALGAIAASIVAINIAMALNPISLIVIGIITLVALVVAAYKKFEGFRKVVDAVFGAIKWWISNVSIPLFNAMLDSAKKVFNAIAGFWNKTLGKIGFTIPKWVPGIGGNSFNFPDIPMLADGGIVSRATLAVVGEAGPEAVIPLDRLGQYGGAGGTTVNINVQGADPQAVVDALRVYMYRNGSVPIKVA